MKFEHFSQNYADAPLKIMSPMVAYSNAVLGISFLINFVPATSKSSILLCNCRVADKYGREMYPNEGDLYIPKEKSAQKIYLNFDSKKQSVSLHEAKLYIGIMTESGNLVQVCYVIKDVKTLQLLQVSIGKMGEEEKNFYIDAMQVYSESQSHAQGGNGSKTQSRSAENDNTNEEAYTPKLTQYVKSVYREMYYLRDEGGRKYKVTNGRFIMHQNDAYYYSFDMESELYLSDDAPISLTVGTETASGTVMISDGFQLIVVIDRDFGTTIGSGFISVEPWKLLQKLNDRLLSIDENDTLALKLLEEGPTLASNAPIATIPRGQEIAIKTVLNSDITIIWGPPGTGKTYTMANLAKQFVQQGKSVLIVSHSNISVDNVIKQIEHQLRASHLVDPLIGGKILRYGYCRDEELSHSEYVVSFDRAVKSNPTLFVKYEELLRERERLKKAIAFAPSPDDLKARLRVEKEIKAIGVRARDVEKRLVSDAQVVATTISKVYMDKVFEHCQYDVVMFDEVSMAYVPQLVCAAKYAREKFIGVGDFRQLAPIVQSDAKKVLGQDIFTYLGICDTLNNIHPHPWLVMLDEQRRMHPDISRFSRETVYRNLLKDHASVSTKWGKAVATPPFEMHPMTLVNLMGTYCVASKTGDNSRYNIISAMISFATALRSYSAQRETEHIREASVGIVTPYAAQTRLIRAMIQDLNEKNVSMSCSTVHQFQGSERNTVVFDAVESFPSTRVGWLMSRNENNSVTRLINVALTRARSKFVVVANKNFWLHKLANSQNLFYKLVQHMNSCGHLVQAGDDVLKRYLLSLDFGKNIQFFTSYDGCRELLKRDISHVKPRGRILISLPDEKMDPISSAEILACLSEERTQGVDILGKTKVYEKLPESWKKYCWKSDDAHFPLLAIDNKVIWYGIPAPQSPVWDGNYGYSTVCQLYFRITGPNTVEMIKSLTDLEYATVESRRTRMQPKYDKPSLIDDKGITTVGLIAYIKENEICTACKKPMRLARGKSGKPYLRCTACDNTALLSTQFVDKYIAYEHIRCPKCKGSIYAKSGMYGLYIKCNSEHNLKPEEI